MKEVNGGANGVVVRDERYDNAVAGLGGAGRVPHSHVAAEGVESGE